MNRAYSSCFLLKVLRTSSEVTCFTFAKVIYAYCLQSFIFKLQVILVQFQQFVPEWMTREISIVTHFALVLV